MFVFAAWVRLKNAQPNPKPQRGSHGTQMRLSREGYLIAHFSFYCTSVARCLEMFGQKDDGFPWPAACVAAWWLCLERKTCIIMLSQGSTRSGKEKKKKTLRAKSHYDVGLVATFLQCLQSLTLSSSRWLSGTNKQLFLTLPVGSWSGFSSPCYRYGNAQIWREKKSNLQQSSYTHLRCFFFHWCEKLKCSNWETETHLLHKRRTVTT